MISMVFGLPGCGKSSYLTKLARQAMESSKYDRVYSNFHIDGAYHFERLEDLCTYDINNALVIFDEATLTYDSRSFKSFSKEAIQAICLHRHLITALSKKTDIWVSAQEYAAVDKKIRDLTSELWYARKLGPISFLAPISRKITISEDSSDILYGYKFGGLLNYKFCWRPKWYKYFDSFEKPERSPIPEDSYLNKQYVHIDNLLTIDKKGRMRTKKRVRVDLIGAIKSFVAKIRNKA